MGSVDSSDVALFFEILNRAGVHNPYRLALTSFDGFGLNPLQPGRDAQQFLDIFGNTLTPLMISMSSLRPVTRFMRTWVLPQTHGSGIKKAGRITPQPL